MRCRRNAPTGRHANPTLTGGSDDEAAGTRRCRLERLPARRLRTSGDIALSYSYIPSAGRNCMSYRPGHQVHWIQAKKAHEPGQPIIAVSVVVRCDGLVDHPLPGPARDDVDLQLCLSELPRRWWTGAVAAPLPCVERERHPVQPHGTGRPGSAETLPASGVVVASYAVGGSAIHTLTQMANGLCCNRYPRRAGCRRTSSPV